MNKVNLTGRVVRDPEIKTVQKNNKNIFIAKYTLAVNKRFKAGNNDADFITCTAMGKFGELADKYITKGMMLSVVGSLQNNNWKDKDGNMHYALDVIVEEQEFMSSKKDANNSYPTANSNDDDDSCLPFA